MNFSFSPPTACDHLGGDHYSFLIVEYTASILKLTSKEANIQLDVPTLDQHLRKMTELADLVFCIFSEQAKLDESRCEDAGIADYRGGILMRWAWKRQAQARPIEPRRAVNSRAMELETAKEILAEIFHEWVCGTVFALIVQHLRPKKISETISQCHLS